MEVYTNAMVVKELITNQTEIKVYQVDQHVLESTEVDLFLFYDNLLQFNHLFDKVCLHESTVLRKRPDWGGTIFEMMKNNKHVFLFDRVWYQGNYKADQHNFWFDTVGPKGPKMDHQGQVFTL